MKVILFGASGMVGQGALLECLADPQVERVLSVVRRPSGQTHPKVEELVHDDFTDYSRIEARLAGFDACLFCLGISSVGLSEAEYTRITYDYALAAGRALARANPGLTLCFVSGAGTDSTEQGRSMWARVKGRTENDLLKLPLKGAYMFRPGYIQPAKGIASKTRLYRAAYAIGGWLYPILKRLFPGAILTNEVLGRAMIRVAKDGAPKHVLEAKDINAVVGA